ncbi:MAG: MBL fold metallo-hydrolase [Chloroflexi bacterium]|nr:MAG: MBL fold metallo-hydrolase [Chloroflexota bacterium]MBL1195654.1 MBL fold metallo-hydrolase [Chloroflexota bacterium]NOH12942.1 MBL fold metallo-hydrolase [Chloroflexota bacterium]
MRLNFFGAAQTVTGSQHYLEVNGHSLLLDCGLYQGRRKEAEKRNREFRFDPTKLDAVLLSHGHIDHSGNLPNLVKNGYEGPIHAQTATTHLSKLMLEDSGRIQEYDAEFINRRNAKRGRPLVEPLYTQEDASRAAGLFKSESYSDSFEPIPGVIAQFHEAGHILGSAAISLDIEEKGRKVRLWFSGDVGRPNMPLIRDPKMPTDADYLLMECTYGYKPHEPYGKAHEELMSVVNKTLKRGGKVIIPAFAVGRTQELVYALHRMMDERTVPQVPVYVDSPLAVNVTDVFRAHPECFDEEAREMIESDEHRAALGFDTLTYIRSVDESKALNGMDEPMIIISASGMLEAGRIRHHLVNNIDDERNTLLIVSWQAPHTLGRRMLEGHDQVKIFGETHDVKMRVERANGFSAHGGQTLLREYADAVKGSVKDIFLVHGEEKGAVGITEALNTDGFDKVHFPALGSSVEL